MIVKMKIIFLMLALFAGITVQAQQLSPFASIQSGNQQLIEDAVKDGIFLVRRCYRLQDTTSATPRFFGWGNLPYFGETFSVAVKTKNGYIISDKAVRPWIYDGKFEQEVDPNRFVPVLSTNEYRTMGNTDFIAFPDRNTSTREVSINSVYSVEDNELFEQKGFFIHDSDEVIRGWLVWIVFNNPLEGNSDEQTPTFTIFRSELTFEQGTDVYDIPAPAIDRHIVGGIYVMPKITDIGQTTFHLSGFLHKEGNQWKLVRLGNVGTGAAVQQAPAQTGGLTPIEGSENNENGTSGQKRGLFW